MAPTSGNRKTVDGDSLDTVFGLLADERRRLLLYLLREHGEANLDDLADVLTGWLAVRRGGGVGTPEARRKLYVSLYHTHVPKLRGAGIVTFDEGTTVVSFEPPSEELDRLLDTALEMDTGTADASVPELVL